MQAHRPPLYVLPGHWPGLVIKGTIDINNRPRVANRAEGGISTVYSASDGVEVDGHLYEMLFPQVIKVGGKWIIASRARAKAYALRTGQHLGMFNTWQNADRYARALHIQQARLLQADRFKKAGHP